MRCRVWGSLLHRVKVLARSQALDASSRRCSARVFSRGAGLRRGSMGQLLSAPTLPKGGNPVARQQNGGCFDPWQVRARL